MVLKPGRDLFLMKGTMDEPYGTISLLKCCSQIYP